MRYSGTSTVTFIAGLIPLYIGEHLEGIYCARSLGDGTLILPKKCDPHDEPADQDEWVTVWWQGDEQRKIDVPAGFITTKLIAEYVRLHSTGRSERFATCLLDHLIDHYERKTGQTTVLYPRDESALDKVLDFSQKLGFEVVVGGLSSSLLDLK